MEIINKTEIRFKSENVELVAELENTQFKYLYLDGASERFRLQKRDSLIELKELINHILSVTSGEEA